MIVWVPGQQVATGISQASRQDAVLSTQKKVPKMDALQDMSSPTPVGTHPPHIPNDTSEHVGTKTMALSPSSLQEIRGPDARESFPGSRWPQMPG